MNKGFAWIGTLAFGLVAMAPAGELARPGQAPNQAPAVSNNAPAPVPIASDGQTSKLERKILGDWILENSSGNQMSPMRIQKTAAGTLELIRIGGGPYAVCGEYEIGKMDQLVKVKKPGDAYWDLTWKYFNGKLELKKGQYRGWTLLKEKK